MYLFELGRQPEISQTELESVFSFFSFDYQKIAVSLPYVIMDIKNNFDATAVMQRLGGTIKIGRQVAGRVTAEGLAQIIQDFQLEGKIQFSLSGKKASAMALETKKILKAEGRSVRYIEANNTATILHNNLVAKQGDFTLMSEGVFVTEAIQQIEDWGERDFGRPGRDSKSGMLPPKLARMMINIARGTSVTLQNIADQHILDPFCGSGTILMEALLLGYKNIIGSDISDQAIHDTKINIEWVRNKAFVPSSGRGEIEKQGNKGIEIFQSDVRRIVDKIQPQSIDVIATEPFLGRPLKGSESKESLQKQAHELKTLYVLAFQSFAKIMKKHATAVFLIPRFKYKQEWIRVHCTEEIQKLGFTIESLSSASPFLVYSRPDQLVAREIWKFTKH